MNFKHCAMATVAISGMLLTATVNAQVYDSVSNKSFSSFLGPNDGDYVYDVSTDAIGNRYMCGYFYNSATSTYTGFVTKVTKKGFLAWKTLTSDFPSCVAPDNLGNVYVAVPDGTSFGVRQMNAATGGINYTSAPTSYGGPVNDIAIMPDGDPVTASDTASFSADYEGLLLKWPAANNSAAYGWYALDKPSHLNKVIVGPDGAVYAGGYSYDDDDSGYIDAMLMYIRPGFDKELLPVPTYALSNSDEYFTDLALDPITNVVIGVGQSYTNSFNDGTPLIGTFRADNSTSDIVPSTNIYYLPDYPTGSQCQAVVADPENSSFAIAVTSGIGGTTGASVYSVVEYAPAPTNLGTNWVSSVPTTDTGTYNFAFDICMDQYGPVLGVVSDLTIGTGSTSYQGIQTYSYTHTGTYIDRQIFGQHSVSAPYASSPYFDYLRDAMSASGGFLTMVAAGTDSHASLRTAQLKNGPDDSYRVDEDATLTVGAAKSVLNNDGNEFRYDPLTAQAVTSSISTGIKKLTFNSNGTFTATFNPNFNGVAHFNYKVKQNGVVISTNHVTINVKPKNDAPTAVDDSFNVGKNSAVANLNVLGNDSDLDGDDITILSKTNNANATIGITSNKKYITFKPKAGFTGNVGFDYVIRDPQGLQSTAHVVVHVN